MVLDQEASRPGAGRVVNRVGVVLVALIAGALLPATLIYAAGARDPLPPSCRAGQPTGTTFDGTIVYTRPGELWLAERDVGRSRKLVDLNPAPPPSPSPAPGTEGLPAASPASTSPAAAS
ncbi:MAG: hypothetical protein QOE92_2173, partial [Chloroflexota bacterium]|nr:hypothetical protein [Chloroflexota bacterium]